MKKQSYNRLDWKTPTIVSNQVEPERNYPTWYASIKMKDGKTLVPTYERKTNIIPEVRSWAEEQSRLLGGKLEYFKAYQN